MTSTFKRIIFVGIMFIVLAGAAVAIVVTGGCSPSVGGMLEGAKTGTMNFLIDASGIKDRLDSDLRSSASALAEEYGLPQSMVDNFVDELDIKDWKAVTLPEGSVETGTVSIVADGTPVDITTYEDPSIVTIGAYGQVVTMAVPETVQEYVGFVSYL